MKILSAVIVTLLFFALVPPGAVLADQADPDSTPDISSGILGFNVYRNLRVSDDYLLIIYVNIPYASQPDDDVTDAFIWQFYDTDNTTVLGQTTGSVYQSGGYGYNIFSMYWTAADAPTWGTSYPVRLTGNPAVFDDPPTYNYLIESSDYDASVGQYNSQTALALRIINIATDLGNKWGASYDLITQLETSTVLSGVGEEVMRAAVRGLQEMAPGAFSLGRDTITAEDRTWSTDYADNVTGQYSGTFIGTAQTAGGTLFGRTYDLTSIIILFVLMVALIIGEVWLGFDIWFALLDCVLVAVIFAKLGIPAALLSFLGLVAGLCWIYTSAKVWGIVR